jgi:threonine aldolase
MFFASDNSGPVADQVWQALAQANIGYKHGYGADDVNAKVIEKIRTLFEAPEAAVYLVPTGTAANALALATMTNPWETIFCTPMAHINVDECNAPEFYTGGAKLTLVGATDKMTPADLKAAIEREEDRGVHGPQRGPVSLTQITEDGRVYTLDELRALTDVAKSYNLSVHLDGARFANAVVALGCTPAEMTWKVGVDVVCFGGTKNGLLSVEAVILFDQNKAMEFEFRRKRAGHLFSKHRYLSAQMLAYLTDDLWLDLATRSNASAARLADGFEANANVEFLYRPDGNLMFVFMPRWLHQKAFAAGAHYYTWGDVENGPADEMIKARFVCDWSVSHETIDAFLDIIR